MPDHNVPVHNAILRFLYTFIERLRQNPGFYNIRYYTKIRHRDGSKVIW